VSDAAPDPARAGYHIQPTRGWINDPNGMLYRDGRWHVFFQHNPTGAFHTDIHWGHVSSDDFVSWHEHAVAFGPTPEGPDRVGCWSGVCVDLGDRVAAVYTGIVTDPVDSTVCIRYASDPDLDRWSDPISVATVPALPPGETQVREMRDPFVFQWGGRRWALLGAGLTDGTPALLLWSCDDLETWRFERVWLGVDDPLLASAASAEIWECPQLVEVDGTWALFLSIWRDNQLEGTVAAVGSLGSTPDGSPGLSVRACRGVDDGRSLYAVTLRGTELSVTLQPGAEAWLDGEVLEVYPPDAPPRTYRDPGTAAWRLVGDGSAATVRSVAGNARRLDVSAGLSSGAPPG